MYLQTHIPGDKYKDVHDNAGIVHNGHKLETPSEFKNSQKMREIVAYS